MVVAAGLVLQQAFDHEVDIRLVEAADVLDRFRPATLGQASRLAGVNPADLTLVAVAIRKGPPAAPSAPAASGAPLG